MFDIENVSCCHNFKTLRPIFINCFSKFKDVGIYFHSRLRWSRLFVLWTTVVKLIIFSFAALKGFLRFFCFASTQIRFTVRWSPHQDLPFKLWAPLYDFFHIDAPDKLDDTDFVSRSSSSTLVLLDTTESHRYSSAKNVKRVRIIA